MNYLLIISRVIFGGYFIINGYKHVANGKKLEDYAMFKKVPYPKLSVFASGILLLVGGVGIFFGIYTQLAVACIVLFMVPVTFMMHNYWKHETAEQRAMENIAFAKNLAITAAALAYLFV